MNFSYVKLLWDMNLSANNCIIRRCIFIWRTKAFKNYNRQEWNTSLSTHMKITTWPKLYYGCHIQLTPRKVLGWDLFVRLRRAEASSRWETVRGKEASLFLKFNVFDLLISLILCLQKAFLHFNFRQSNKKSMYKKFVTLYCQSALQSVNHIMNRK